MLCAWLEFEARPLKYFSHIRPYIPIKPTIVISYLLIAKRHFLIPTCSLVSCTKSDGVGVGLRMILSSTELRGSHFGVVQLFKVDMLS
jgi:hypothetical protein